MRKQVLIVTEEWAGSGHYMAAIALQEALEEENCEVSIIGGLDVASPMLRSLSRSTYYTSLACFPAFWDKLYNRDAAKISQKLQKPLAKVLGKRLLDRIIEQRKPDIVVSTHAYCLSALAEAKQKASKPFQMIGVLTDFHIHPYWLHHAIDYYIVAHPTLAEQMRSMREMEPGRIRSFGIPLRSPFQGPKKRSKAEWKQVLGIKPSHFTVLVCGGTDGYGDIFNVVKRLLQSGRALVIAVVTGKNERLKRKLHEQFSQASSIHTLYLFGYVKAMWEWLGAADVVITKAGGLTCSEALAMRTPLILFQPLPGQERLNSRFLVEQGVAWHAQTTEEIALILDRLRSAARNCEQMIQRMDEFGQPDSASRVAKWVNALGQIGDETNCSDNGRFSR